MHSLFDIQEQPRIPLLDEGPSGLPAGYPAKATLNVPGLGKLLLPKHPDGLSAWSEMPSPAEEGDAVPPGMLLAARVALLTRPSFAVALPPPSAEDIASILNGGKFAQHAKPSAFISAVRVSGVPNAYGVATAALVENATGFGQSVILRASEEWFASIEDLAEHLCFHLGQVDNVPIKPLAGAPPWAAAVLLLSGEASQFNQRQRDHIRRIAGLFRVSLSIVDNARSRRTSLVASLRSNPPDGVLVMAETIPDPDTFTSAFAAARPGRYAGVIWSRTDRFDEIVSELCLHLMEFRAREGTVSTYPTTWTAAIAFVGKLESRHFKLTDRARQSLASNRYPDPARMCEHLERLASLAVAYGTADLGERLVTYAKTQHELNISLFDDSTEVAHITFEGETIHPLPHVQVDDGTTFDKCGRVYFALDKPRSQFVVDHVGLHDYGK